MTFQTTFKLATFIKSCNDLRSSVCSDGNATLDKWIALAEKHAVNDEITFTKQIVRNLNRYADAIADTGVSYVYGEDDEFSPELQLCLWALSPRYHVGSVLQIGERLETLRWIAEHYAERFDAELEDAIKDITHHRRLKYQVAFPTSPMTLKYVRTLDQVIAAYNYDASTADCVEKLFKEVDFYGHSRTDNKVITLIYQQLDTLLDNNISLTTLINSNSGRIVLTEIFKSPKAFAQYWERLGVYGLKTEDRDGVITAVDYSDWFIDLSIKVRGFLDVLNDLWDIYLPTTPTGVRIMSKHYEIVGQLPLEDKVYFTDLPLSAIQSMYPDFKVLTLQDVFNSKPCNEPTIITYPERRTMAHVLLNTKQDKLETPKRVNHPAIYVGWPDAFTRNHLNIVEYDGVLEIVKRESPYIQRFASLYHTKPKVNIGDLYRDGADKPYALDHIENEELGSEKIKNRDNTWGRQCGVPRYPIHGRDVGTMIGSSENNMTATIGRGLTEPRFFSDVDLSNLHMASTSRQQGEPESAGDLFDQWVKYIREPHSDFDGDELTATLNKAQFTIEREVELTPAPVQYPIVERNPISELKDNTHYNLFMGRYYAEKLEDTSPLDFGNRAYMPLISTPRMEHVHSVSNKMAEVMNEMFKRRHDGHSEPDALTPFNHHGSPSRLRMAVGEVDIAEAYPNSHIGVDLGNNTDKE